MTTLSESRQAWLSCIDAHRQAPSAPDDTEFWSRRLDRASRDELRAVQDVKIRIAMRYVYESIPFYRRKFDAAGIAPDDIRTVDDLATVPVTTKQEMADDGAAHPPWGTYTAVDDAAWLARGWQTFATSGTTGSPRLFRYTRFDRDVWAWADARALWAMGLRPDRDVAMLAFGYGPHVWLWGVHQALNLMGIPLITAGGLDTSTRARYIADCQPTMLACTPSYAIHLAHVMRDMGLEPSATSVHHLICAGEPGFSVPATRARLEELWRAELHEFYGCTEAAPCAGGYSCAAAAQDKSSVVSTHLMDDLHHWEVVDPQTLRPVPEGERGITVVTNLCSEASPQVRFVVGDFTRLTRAPCACGRSHTRALGGFVGRADDMLNIRGVTVFPSTIEDAVRRVPGIGDEYLIVVTRRGELDELLVRVEPATATSTAAYDDLARRVSLEIRSRCELRPKVEVVPPGDLPRTEFKARRVRDLRGIPSGRG